MAVRISEREAKRLGIPKQDLKFCATHMMVPLEKLETRHLQRIYRETKKELKNKNLNEDAREMLGYRLARLEEILA